ncbi:Ribonuclease H-like domain containing protein [Parasponia andersonii]|uniref:Ribonuclease H-like domain containing protein n=1 Tax=Parasponia andersonii TaxID=3476 RepID=A0A2P5D5B6_PARAD|nr:Ribonuclease H-like domain containing protein [Parasponia andersonii]
MVPSGSGHCLAQAIWIERNSIVHGGVPNHLETIILRAEEAAGAAVARDEHGMVLALTAAPFPHPEPVMAETAAILLGLQLAQDYAWISVIIEFDCLNLVNCWNGSTKTM